MGAWLHPAALLAKEESDGRNRGGNDAAGATAYRRVRANRRPSGCWRCASGCVVERGRMRREASPTGDAHEAEAVERGTIVVGDAAGEDVALPGTGGDFKALQLAQSFQQSVLAAQTGTGCEMLPTRRPMHELGRRYWLNLLSEGCDREPVNACEQTAVAPLDDTGGAAEMAAKDCAGGFEAQQGSIERGEGNRATIDWGGTPVRGCC